MMGRETLAKSPFESASVAFCVVDGGGDVLEVQKFREDQKNCVRVSMRSRELIKCTILECKKFAKTKKWNSKKKCSSAGATGRCFEAHDRLPSH